MENVQSQPSHAKKPRLANSCIIHTGCCGNRFLSRRAAPGTRALGICGRADKNPRGLRCLRLYTACWRCRSMERWRRSVLAVAAAGAAFAVYAMLTRRVGNADTALTLAGLFLVGLYCAVCLPGVLSGAGAFAGIQAAIDEMVLVYRAAAQQLPRRQRGISQPDQYVSGCVFRGGALVHRWRALRGRGGAGAEQPALLSALLPEARGDLDFADACVPVLDHAAQHDAGAARVADWVARASNGWAGRMLKACRAPSMCSSPCHCCCRDSAWSTSFWRARRSAQQPGGW